MKIVSALSACLFLLSLGHAYAEERTPRPILLTDDYNNICDGKFAGWSGGYITAVGVVSWGVGQFYINFKANKDQKIYVYLEDSAFTLDTAFGKATYAAALQANAVGSPVSVYCTGTTDPSGNPNIRDLAFGATANE